MMQYLGPGTYRSLHENLIATMANEGNVRPVRRRALQNVDDVSRFLLEWTFLHIEQRLNVSSYLVLDLGCSAVRRILSSH